MKRWIAAAMPLVVLWAVSACAQGFGTGFPSFPVPNPVKGVPFSAETVSESASVLQDGNHIKTATHGKIFRDSAGRTRTETTLGLPGVGEMQVVSINDPIQQVMISFGNRGDKKATIYHMHSALPAATASEQSPARDASADGTKAPADVEPCEVGPGEQELPTKTIEGIEVRGSRETSTIEAGKIGNEKPIVSVTESWYSDELQVMVLTESDDPQVGHTTTKLVNIQRAEPDAALFQVPPGYTVKDIDPSKMAKDFGLAE